MKRFLILIIIIVGLFSSLPLRAQEVEEWHATEKTLKHAKDAAYWAGRDRWVDAVAHAKKAEDPLLAAVFEWMQYKKGSRFSTFDGVAKFIDGHSDWPKMKNVRSEAELSIDKNDKRKKLVEWFTEHKDVNSETRKFRVPVTATGKRMLAESIISMGSKVSRANKEFIGKMIRSVWINGDFKNKDELGFLDLHGPVLRAQDHESRVVRLLWSGKASEAERSLKRIVDKSKRKLYGARVKLQKNQYGLDAAIKAVPKRLVKDEGLLYDRIKWRMKRSTKEGVIALLKELPSQLNYPHAWWKIKTRYLDTLLQQKNYEFAYKLFKNHGFTNNIYYFAEGEWEAGWIAYKYLKDPQRAYPHFYNMYHRVQTPISLGRAAYWSGRMASMNDNVDIAKKWFAVAADYSSSFYGQLATHRLGSSILVLPEAIVPTTADYETYYGNKLLRAAYILSKVGLYKDGRELVLQAVKNAESQEVKALIAQFGNEIDRLDYGVIAAKSLARGGKTYDLLHNYPVISPLLDSKNREIKLPEAALVHAITLQESIFDNKAKSYAGARGMMQLMSPTAKEVARKMKLKYSRAQLYNVKYNMGLGSFYLNSLLERFDGSYILAIAAYNGGQGNVRKWLRKYGDPRKFDNPEDVIDWIEEIPFSETQSYVQRVIENLQIYRYKINGSSVMYARTIKDIMR
jgi:soluble lytic murein transglycosylase